MRRALHISSASLACASLISLAVIGYDARTLVLVMVTVIIAGAAFVLTTRTDL